jgi:hypothetical protein
MSRHLQQICSKISPMGCSSTHSGGRRSCRLLRSGGRSGRPRRAANAARSRWSRLPGQRCRPPVARSAGGIARPDPGEPLAPVPHPLFVLFYQVEIRHRQLRRDRGCLARRDHAAGQCRGDPLHRRGDVVGLQPTGFVPWGHSRSAARQTSPRVRGMAAGCVRYRAASRPRIRPGGFGACP